mmetsp:Transcript_13082/g.15017  ORF Transcript_13082/g.15017 Transcript_13082/m.15017 type:complete len:214 (+) Transcript_13082:144-785(+)
MGSKRRNVNNQQQKEEYDHDERSDTGGPSAYDGPADGGSFQVASQDKRAKRRIVNVSSRGRFKNMAATAAESKTPPPIAVSVSSPSRNTNPFGSIVITPSARATQSPSVSDDPPPPPNPFSNVSFASAQPPSTGGFSFGKKQDTKATPITTHIKRKSVVFNSPMISDSEEETARHQAQVFLETVLIGHALQRPQIIEHACHGGLERAAQRRRR